MCLIVWTVLFATVLADVRMETSAATVMERAQYLLTAAIPTTIHTLSSL